MKNFVLFIEKIDGKIEVFEGVQYDNFRNYGFMRLYE